MAEYRSEDDIDGEYVTRLRRDLSKGQAEFWSAIRISQPRGHRYEIGATKIPASVRLLLFVRYVAGLDLDNPKLEGFRELKRLRKAQKENKQ